MIEASTSYTHKLIHTLLTDVRKCVYERECRCTYAHVREEKETLKKNACSNSFYCLVEIPHKDALLVIHLFRPTILISSYLIFLGPFSGETQ